MNKKYIALLSAMTLALGAVAAKPKQEVKELNAPGDISVLEKAAEKFPDHPIAPAKYRRPEGYTPHLYKLNLQQISDAYSADTMKRGRALYDKVAQINKEGKWNANAQSIDKHKCPEWFIDAKFGIFVDWGLWSLASWAPKREKHAMYPDWYEYRMYNNYDSKSPFWGYKSYHIKNWGEDFKRDHFIPLFKAEEFDAEKLCDVFKDCGAKYVVPFLKHHSGFCLWPSSFTLRDVGDMGPRRDIAGELVEACRKQDLKFGFYFSTHEWEYPMLDANGKIQKLHLMKISDYEDDLEHKCSGKIAVKDFIKEYSVPQAIEFIDKYNPDILWYDYDWSDYATNLGVYEMSAYFYNKNEGVKEVAVNDRYGRGQPEELVGKFTKERPRKWLRTVRGDFYTDEYGDTSECIDPSKYHPWEACRGISQSYGNNWQDDASNVITTKEFISMFADMVARGGNLLLLINLDGQGAIPEIQKTRLLEIGAWLKKYGEAIYATRIIAPFATKEVAYTRTKDAKTAFAIVKEPKKEIEIAIVPLKDSKVYDVYTKEKLSWKLKDKYDASKGIIVELSDDLAKSELPIALKLKIAE